ncbi:hypothetical protein BLA60_33785 [Actinophytocola xinjiangensis]|uniref:Uncharacterized protein n=1 Tax=Actinophytocola xinjiangensis TaxID=485602 RepID=A0A7Z0WFH7_9PSEU|nr:hypothetical protein [Actinophytocola xinjiangensis]OLF06019.1 hypothetical protein BLA60_33785 [Actinophytocola xinjiangensis]
MDVGGGGTTSCGSTSGVRRNTSTSIVSGTPITSGPMPLRSHMISIECARPNAAAFRSVSVTKFAIARPCPSTRRYSASAIPGGAAT